MTPAERRLDLAVGAVRAHLPPGVSALDLDGFLRRQRPALLALIQQHFAPLLGGSPPEEVPELWTVAQRTAATSPP